MKRFLSSMLILLLVISGLSFAAAEDATDEPVTFSIFVDHPWFWVDTFDDEVAQEITRQSGVYFDVTRATDDTQLPIMISSGDLPDIVYTSSTTAATQLSDPEVCWSYNELVEKTGVDLDTDAMEILNNTAADGNYYQLKNAFTPQSAFDAGTTLAGGGTTSLAYRVDIYEAIGSPELNTLDDVENALVAAHEMYPDIVPMLNDPAYMRNYISVQLGVNPGNVSYADDGVTVQHRLSNPGSFEVYEVLNRWARKGLITAEAQTYNFDKFTEVRNSGLSFMQIRASDEAQTANNAAIASGSDYRWKLLDHELSDEAAHYSTGIGWSGFFITKNCEDPERAMEFFAWARQEENRKLCSWGIQGVHWDYNDEGQTVTTEYYQDAMSEGKQKQKDFGIAVWIFGDKGEESAFVDNAATNPDWVDVIARLRSAASYMKVQSELYFAIPQEGDELTIYTKLDEMMKSEELKVIFAESEEEMKTAFDAMIEKAQQIGLDELNEWMNTTLTEHLSKNS